MNAINETAPPLDPQNAHQTHVADSHGDRLDTQPETSPAPNQPNLKVDNSKGLGGSIWATLAVVAIIVIVVIAYGILHRKAEERKLEHTTVEASVPIVAVIHPSGNRLANELSLPGATQAYVDTPIYSRTNGYLKQWFFDIGAHVHRGQLMATIETPEVDQQLQVAQADLKSAQANLDLANTTQTRYQNLLKSNSVSKQETDEAIGNALAKNAAVEASQAAVRRLQQLQSFEKIYAPFDGIVTARNTDVGALIVAGQEGNGANARELFHLAAIDRIRVFVSVPEADTAAIVDGEHVSLTSDQFPGRSFDGVVTRNANAVDPSTRTLNVEVDVPNSAGTLLPGAYVFAHFKLSSHGQYLTLPSNTLIFRSQGLQVALVRDGRVHLVPVTIASDGGEIVEISSGVTATDQVITDPSDSIADGQQVTIAGQQGPQENGAAK
ncbi:efflux RND transporter periplasmic adaptor subunit [Granulicella tundricola]|uniref:Efflux transporter, RND family, MFP subunit n=1 Tax=Granulicella tundricola (strain ATCC BAA-1859 / DSM 23138 / MP5ACTX9) TaxID=1198114 RepID=E8WXY7_GRATM|nr:efflux RND transporter periplasmic adaptor subunit [Granulicella tundricola]ADW67526.1 efflux transporter, RND family, MFP subunit [Granulicella tundricola MP5ACTX9]